MVFALDLAGNLALSAPNRSSSLPLFFSCQCCSMASSVRVAAAQMTSVNDLAANFNTCSRLVKDAVAAGAKMLCLPENFSFVGAKSGESLTIAESLEGPIMQSYCSLARESNIWLSLGGFQEKGPDDAHLFNTHVLIDDLGNIRSTYRKMHLFDVHVLGGAIYKESSFTAADFKNIKTACEDWEEEPSSMCHGGAVKDSFMMSRFQVLSSSNLIGRMIMYFVL